LSGKTVFEPIVANIKPAKHGVARVYDQAAYLGGRPEALGARRIRWWLLAFNQWVQGSSPCALTNKINELREREGPLW
jgi:hypothetical protein